MSDIFLITGGAGFIGSTLAISLKRAYRGARVVALDNLRRRGSEHQVGRLHAEEVEFMHGDVRAPEDLTMVPGCDVLIDCAAEPSVLAGYRDQPSFMIRSNLEGTLHCLELARRHKANFIFMSTSRVYPYDLLRRLPLIESDMRFNVDSPGISESFSLEGPRTLYGATKLASELVLQEYLATYDMRGVINRCGVVAGPYQMGKTDQGFVPYWVASHLAGNALQYIGYGGSGKQVRDILHVNDLVDLTLKELDCINRISGTIYNVGGGITGAVSLKELTTICENVTNKKISIQGESSERLGDIPWYVTNHTRASMELDWKPKLSPQKIVEDISEWLQKDSAALQVITSPK